MGLILLIETSSTNCSVALSRDGIVVSCQEQSSDTYIHAESLHPFIEKLFIETNLTLKDIDAVGVSKGPGSYTGLRIGAAAAKGLCFALNKPLIGMSTTQILAHYGSGISKNFEYIMPMIDARRMEVYCALYDKIGKQLEMDAAQILDEAFFSRWKNDSIMFIGDGAKKCQGFVNENHIIESVLPGAAMMASMAEELFQQKQFDNIDYFEPFYLKDYLPGVSTKSLL